MGGLEAALDLAARGFFVFPLTPGSKRPYLKGGYKLATRDELQIADWWLETPDANIGIAPAASRHIVLDIDRKGKVNGYPSLDKLLADGLPPTLTTETPSGGLHLYYRLPAGVDLPPSGVNVLGEGIDIRCRGGYVLAPGSRLDGKSYCFKDERPAAELPVQFLKKLPKPEADHSQDFQTSADLTANIERAKAFLLSTAPAVEGHGGDDWTFKTAALVRDFAISEETCYRLMLDYWNDRCDPPWDPDDLRHKIENAYAYAKRSPGEARALTEATRQELAKKLQSDEKPPAYNPFRPLPWDEVLALPEPDWMIEGFLPERSIVEMYGPWGSYKSFLSIDVALHLATGLDWCGRKTLNPRKVLYVAGEGVFGIRKRVEAWASHHNQHNLHNFQMVPQMPVFREAKQAEDFSKATTAFSPDLIMLDTFAAAIAGWNENSAEDVEQFMAICRAMREHYRASIWLIHHTGKDIQKGSRGSSALPAACDVVLQVRAEPKSAQPVLFMEKMKDAEAWSHGQAFKGKAVGRSLVFLPTKDNPSIDEIQKEIWRRETLKALEARRDANLPLPVTTGELAKDVALNLDNVSEQQIRNHLRRYGWKHPQLRPYAVLDKDGKNASEYSFPLKKED